MAKKRSHPLDSLTWTAPKLEEVRSPVLTGDRPLPPAPSRSEEETRSSNVTLPVRVWEWIDAKHAEARSAGGKPLRKAAIIRAVFEVVMAAEVDLAGAQSEAEIVERLNRALRQ